MIHVEAAMVLDWSRDEVYSFWRNPENLPRFMERLESVTIVDPWRSFWVLRTDGVQSVAWYVEVVADTTDELIAWKSISRKGEVPDYASEARFHDADDGRGTRLELEVKCRPDSPAARVLGDDPEGQVHADILRLAAALARVKDAAAGPPSPPPPAESPH